MIPQLEAYMAGIPAELWADLDLTTDAGKFEAARLKVEADRISGVLRVFQAPGLSVDLTATDYKEIQKAVRAHGSRPDWADVQVVLAKLMRAKSNSNPRLTAVAEILERRAQETAKAWNDMIPHNDWLYDEMQTSPAWAYIVWNQSRINGWWRRVVWARVLLLATFTPFTYRADRFRGWQYLWHLCSALRAQKRYNGHLNRRMLKGTLAEIARQIPDCPGITSRSGREKIGQFVLFALNYAALVYPSIRQNEVDQLIERARALLNAGAKLWNASEKRLVEVLGKSQSDAEL